MDEKILKFFAEYIESELGIVYNEVNYNGLSKRLEEIKELLQLPSIQHLFEFCQESGVRGIRSSWFWIWQPITKRFFSGIKKHLLCLKKS